MLNIVILRTHAYSYIDIHADTHTDTHTYTHRCIHLNRLHVQGLVPPSLIYPTKG